MALNSTLNVNNHDEISNSFDNKGNMDILGGNFGDISMINNTRYQENNALGAQIEADDLALKLMLEDVNKILYSKISQTKQQFSEIKMSPVQLEHKQVTPNGFTKSSSRYLECNNNDIENTLMVSKISNAVSQLPQINSIPPMNMNLNVVIQQNQNQQGQFTKKALLENFNVNNVNPMILETIKDDLLFKKDINLLTHKNIKIESLQPSTLKSKQSVLMNFSTNISE